MRFHEIKKLIEQEQRLDELTMSPSALRQFAKSEIAQGIRAGFEAEIIFPDMGGSDDDDYDIEPDYDADERVHGIEDIIEFFSNDDWGYGLDRNSANRLRSKLEEQFFEYRDEKMREEFDDRALEIVREYIEQNHWDQEDEIRERLEAEGVEDVEYVIDVGTRNITNTDGSEEENRKYSTAAKQYRAALQASEEALDARAQESLDEQDRYYDDALDEFGGDWNEVDDSDWLSSIGVDSMTDAEREFDLSWPIMTSSGSDNEDGFSEANAEMLADELSSALGVKTHSSGGYHSTKRDDVTWIFEPDSSLEADSGDMPVEIVSPPMGLAECLDKMGKFFEWAKGYGAYTNKSTGFHMGVSLPGKGGDVDFVKLALFLGDEHVLQQFGRAANGYAVAAMKKIRERVKPGGAADIQSAMNLMRQGLIDVAHEKITSDSGFGKYTSINPKGNYIEFRSAGGEDYFADINKLKNTLLRYAQAMAVAADPAAERQEYYKKLYKLISPAKGNAALDLFARFATGTITAEELKAQWADTALSTAPESKRTSWRVYDRATNKHVDMPGVSFNDMTRAQAMHEIKSMLSPASSWTDFALSFDEKYELRDIGTNTGKWSVIDRETGNTLEVISAPTRGEAADISFDKYGETGTGKGTYYIEPTQADATPAKPNRRAELAKRIKANKEKAAMAGKTMYVIIDKTTGQQGEPFPADSIEGAQMYANRVARADGHTGNFSDKFTLMKKTENGLEPVTATAPAPTSSQQQTLQPGQYWELYNTNTSQPVYRLEHTNRVAAAEEARQWLLMTDRDIERYAIRAAGDAQQSGTQQQAPAQPQQVTTDSGVPMWEIYDRRSGQAVNRFPDHNQTAAWSTAQQWARDAHVPEDRMREYSVRPMMQGQ
jgi:hypothetical protein